MNPSSNETAGANLPPVGEPLQAGNVAQESTPSRPEQAAPGPDLSAPSSSPVSSLPPVMPLPLPIQNNQTVPQTDVSGTSQSVVQNVTDDADLIEKEWVEKAKAIVESNREDPFRQSEELTVVKADYLRNRYNKTIKQSS